MTKAAIVSEATILRQVIEVLTMKRVLSFRHTPVKLASRQGRTIFLPCRDGEKGVADIIGIHRGVPIAIEAKSSVGKQSPDQAAFQLRWEQEGGRYVIVRSVEDLLAFLLV